MQNTITPPAETTVKRNDLQQHVTDTIIRQLEEGTVPWLQPWKGGNSRLPALPKNFTTNKRYNGINILLLWGAAIEKEYASNEWATFKQWSEKKELIRKGEKGNMVVYYDTIEKEVDGELKEIPFLKSSYVFNRCQLASYTPPAEDQRPIPYFERMDRIEQFIENTHVYLEESYTGACYLPSADVIQMPIAESFIDTEMCTATEHYYSTLLHELVHWSGNEKRLNRQLNKKFGSMEYAAEELIAEMGSAFLCAELQINPIAKADHANYIAGWLTLLKNNKKYIFSAASEASKAVDFLRGFQPQS